MTKLNHLNIYFDIKILKILFYEILYALDNKILYILDKKIDVLVLI
jgi:hypothetical protein